MKGPFISYSSFHIGELGVHKFPWWGMIHKICLRASLCPDDTCGHAGVFSEEAAASDPQPCSVSEFPSAVARMIGLPEPHYVLFTADLDPETGAPWCPDCARCLDAARSRVAAVGGTLLEVQVLQLPVCEVHNPLNMKNISRGPERDVKES